MGRSRKIQDEPNDESQTDETTTEKDMPNVMSISQLNQLTEKEKQLFRDNGGTTTEN